VRRPRPELILAAVLLVSFGTAGPASAGRADAEPSYRPYFAVERPENRGLVERALEAVGFHGDEVGRSFALVAGVERYPRFDVEGSLPPAAADMAMLIAYLRDQEHFDEIVVLRNEDFTLGNLGYFLNTYFPAQLQRYPRSRFLMAFSGHGVNEDGIGYLLTQHATGPGDVGGGISLAVLRSLFVRVIDKAFHVLVLINACEAGGFVRVSFGDERLIPIHPGAHAIMAGGSTERTWSDSRPGRRGSLFFETMIDGLNGAADVFPDGGDGVITADELRSYMRDRIQRMTSQAQNPNSGDLRAGGSNGSFFFFNRHRQVAARVVQPWDPQQAYAFGSGGSEPAEPEPTLAGTPEAAAEVFARALVFGDATTVLDMAALPFCTDGAIITTPAEFRAKIIDNLGGAPPGLTVRAGQRTTAAEVDAHHNCRGRGQVEDDDWVVFVEFLPAEDSATAGGKKGGAYFWIDRATNRVIGVTG
jgi:hypothetical protein